MGDKLYISIEWIDKFLSEKLDSDTYSELLVSIPAEETVIKKVRKVEGAPFDTITTIEEGK